MGYLASETYQIHWVKLRFFKQQSHLEQSSISLIKWRVELSSLPPWYYISHIPQVFSSDVFNLTLSKFCANFVHLKFSFMFCICFFVFSGENSMPKYHHLLWEELQLFMTSVISNVKNIIKFCHFLCATRTSQVLNSCPPKHGMSSSCGAWCCS